MNPDAILLKGFKRPAKLANHDACTSVIVRYSSAFGGLWSLGLLDRAGIIITGIVTMKAPSIHSKHTMAVARNYSFF